MEIELDQDLLYTALQYHGPKLQEALGNEVADTGVFNALSNLSFPSFTNGQVSDNLDNEKQLKLHRFIVNHSKTFFNVDLLANNKTKQCEDFEANSFTVMPPYEVFGYINKEIKLKHFLNELSEGEIIITSISSKTSGLILKVLCTYSEPIRCVSDINVRGFCPASIPGLSIGDNLCCEVLEVVPEACKLVCGIKGVKCHKKYKDLLGLFNMDNCPQTFKLFHAGKNDDSYDSLLQNSTGFKNPSNICNLELITGLSNDRYSILPALSGSFPEKEIALELRKVQSAQWAIQSVSDGIKYFKAGQHSEAFLCLNKALTIDSLNVEAYVARGALYANLSRFQKAIEDLKSALKINVKHVNGRKYLCETLMGYARTLESQNKLEDALQYYEECLQVMPEHDEAKASIEYLKSTLLVGRTSTNAFESLTKKKIDTDLDFDKSGSSSSSSNNSINSSSSDSSSSGSSTDDDSNSSSDSDSDHTSSSDSSSDGSSGNDSLKLEKERSLSPFSKRLAMMDGNSTNGGGLPCNPSFIVTENSQNQQLNKEKENDIEGRIQKLLLLSQTSKGKKSKQIGLDLQRLLHDACVLKNEEKKAEKKSKKATKDKKKSHKHKKKDSKNKQKGVKDQDHHHKKSKSKKHKFIEQGFENEQQIVQKSSLPDPESVKSNLSSLKDNSFFIKYVKKDKPNDQNVIDKENEQSDMFKVNEILEMPNTYKYAEDPSLIPTPNPINSKFKMQLPTTTTTYVKIKKKEPIDNVPYTWDNNRSSTNHDLIRTQTSNNNDINNTEHTFPTSYDTTNKGYFSTTHPVSANNMDMEFQSKEAYSSPNDKQRSRSRSASKRRMTYSRSRSTGGRSSQSPFKKKPKETSKSKSRSRSGSYPRHRRYSSSRSNRSRSSSRSYSRSRSRSRSMYHRNRMPYYNNRNRGTYYKPRFQNQNHHNRGFQNRGFQHRGGYVHRQNYNNYNNNNWNNRGQRGGGGRSRFFHYRPRQYDRNRHYDRRSYSASPNRRSRSRSKSRSGSRNSSKEYNRKRYSGSGEDVQHIVNNKPKTPPEPIIEPNKWQLDSTDNNGNRNSQDHDEGSIE